MIEAAVEILYSITVALKGPVVIGVLLALAWALFETGAFLRDWIERKRSSAASRHSAGGKTAPPKSDDLFIFIHSRQASDIVQAVMARTSPDALAGDTFESFLDEVEFEAAKRLTRLRIGLRIGPVIGLMGTLIPMGPALMNISKGNLTVMSNDLIIAFSTTVAGLFVGALCYVMLSVRQYWYAKDLAYVERLARTQAEREKP